MKRLISSIVIFCLAHVALFLVALMPLSSDVMSLFSGPSAHFIAFFSITTMMYLIARHSLLAHQHPLFSAVAYTSVLVFLVEIAQVVFTSYRVYATSDMMWGWAGIVCFVITKMLLYDVYLQPFFARLYTRYVAQKA